MKTTIEKDIIIFDGECNLCNGVEKNSLLNATCIRN